jgi:hypothetical protein
MKNSGFWFQFRNLISIVFTPSYGGCGRCHGKWNVVEHHVTDEGNGYGCFPLCETCWTELKTPEGRLPYYMELILNTWGAEPEGQRWRDIRSAVLMGR